MPLPNRVSPEGEIVATDARGTSYGNRGGCFHRDDKTLKRRPFASRQWICCVLEFKNRRRTMMQPGLFTELFFLDEATAFAAGHRPCFECRREDAERYAVLWNTARGRKGRAAAPDMDFVLQSERIDGAYRKVVSRATLGGLPDGAFVRSATGPLLVCEGQLWPWSFAGYGAPRPFDAAAINEVLTPPSTLAILALGFKPKLHESLRAQRGAPG